MNNIENTNAYKAMLYCSLGIGKINGCERFGTRCEAKRKGKKIIDDSYLLAMGYLSDEAENSIALKTANVYGELIGKKYCKEDNNEEVAVLIERAEENLKKLFDAELRENPASYQMYDKSYYMDIFTVKENDFSAKTENEFLDILGKLLGVDCDYTLEDIIDAVIEMEADVNRIAEEFFGVAYRIYLEYCERISDKINSDEKSE